MSCRQPGEAVCGGGVIGIPIAAWRTGELYISLLEIKNRLKTTVKLDPRALIGSFKAAAFAHHELAPITSDGKTRPSAITALVLIHKRPLMSSIPLEVRVH